MGKFFAALILVLLCVWLVPMCAKLDSPVAAVAPVPQAEPPVVASTIAVAAPTPAPAIIPKAEPKPVAKPEIKSDEGLIAKTYRSKKAFPYEGENTLVAITRVNHASVAATGIRMTVAVKGSGQEIARAENKSAEKQAAGEEGYFGLNLPTAVVNAVLDGPDEPGTELEWTLTYRLEGDDAKTTRCFTLKALPRRREPEGITWVQRGTSKECAKP